MDYKEKVIALLNSQELSKEQKEELENIFPELKESEDERIRKALITFFQRFPYERIDVAGTNAKEAIAWLEKQGKNNMGISEATKQKLEDSLNKALEKETPESFNEFLDGQGEQKLADKAERKGMNIVEEDMTPFQKKVFCIIDTTIEEEQGLKQVCDELLRLAHDESMQNTAWSEEDESMLYGVMETERYMLDVVNGIKKFDVGNGAVRKACTEELNWLESLKDRVLTQPKFEWNEEDEDILNTIINHFEIDLECTKNDDIIRWLKSLRPQSQWKPSDLPHWKKSTLPNDNTTGFNSDYFCHKGYNINYKELFEKLPKDD